MKANIVGAFKRNAPFGTEIAFSKGLQQLGVEVNEVDPSYEGESFATDVDFTLVFKWLEGDYAEELKTIDGVKIVYQPDDSRFPHIRSMMSQMRSLCDYAFTFDLYGAQLAEKLGYLKSQQLLLTADPDLYRPLPNVKKDIDFCFVGSLTGGPSHQGRAKMISLLLAAGMNVAYTSDLYDLPKLVELYNRSKVVLNHATDIGQKFGTGYGYQCRHFEAGMTRACVLSNEVLDEEQLGEQKLENFVRYRDERTLIQLASGLVSKTAEFNNYTDRMASALYDEIRLRHLPIHRAEEIVDFVGSL